MGNLIIYVDFSRKTRLTQQEYDVYLDDDLVLKLSKQAEISVSDW